MTQCRLPGCCLCLRLFDPLHPRWSAVACACVQTLLLRLLPLLAAQHCALVQHCTSLCLRFLAIKVFDRLQVVTGSSDLFTSKRQATAVIEQLDVPQMLVATDEVDSFNESKSVQENARFASLEQSSYLRC